MSKFKFARALEAYVKNYNGKNVSIDSFINTDSVRFNSLGGYVEFNSITIASSTIGVLSTWIRPVKWAAATNGRILHFGNSVGSSFLDFYITNAGRLQVDCQLSGVYQYRYRGPGHFFANNTWHHIVLIQNGTTGISMYLDGSQESLQSLITPIDPLVWFNDMSISHGIMGCHKTGSTLVYFYSGLQNNISVFDTVKSIGDLWDGTGKPTDLTGESGLITWWKMGTGDTYPNLIDNVNGLNGTMTGTMVASDIVPIVP